MHLLECCSYLQSFFSIHQRNGVQNTKHQYRHGGEECMRHRSSTIMIRRQKHAERQENDRLLHTYPVPCAHGIRRINAGIVLIFRQRHIYLLKMFHVHGRHCTIPKKSCTSCTLKLAASPQSGRASGMPCETEMKRTRSARVINVQSIPLAMHVEALVTYAGVDGKGIETGIPLVRCRLRKDGGVCCGG